MRCAWLMAGPSNGRERYRLNPEGNGAESHEPAPPYVPWCMGVAGDKKICIIRISVLVVFQRSRRTLVGNILLEGCQSALLHCQVM